jgi:hypothetical protein
MSKKKGTPQYKHPFWGDSMRYNILNTLFNTLLNIALAAFFKNLIT